MVQVARDELLKIKTEQRTATALKTNIPPSARYVIKTGDEVLAHREREKKWIPNLRVVDIDGKYVWINTGQKVLKLHIARVLSKVTNDDDREIITLLKSMSIFSTGGRPVYS